MGSRSKPLCQALCIFSPNPKTGYRQATARYAPLGGPLVPVGQIDALKSISLEPKAAETAARRTLECGLDPFSLQKLLTNCILWNSSGYIVSISIYEARREPTMQPNIQLEPWSLGPAQATTKTRTQSQNLSRTTKPY